MPRVIFGCHGRAPAVSCGSCFALRLCDTLTSVFAFLTKNTNCIHPTRKPLISVIMPWVMFPVCRQQTVTDDAGVDALDELLLSRWSSCCLTLPPCDTFANSSLENSSCIHAASPGTAAGVGCCCCCCCLAELFEGG